MPKYTVERLKLADLVLNPSLQNRSPDAGLVGMVDPLHVESLVKALKARKPLPRPKVRRVPGLGNLVTDGFHTVTARRLVNPDGSCDCDVVEGAEWLDARIDSSGANHDHDDAPKKYTRACKRRNVLNLLVDLKTAGKKWTAGRVAEECKVSDEFARQIMKELQAAQDAAAPDPDQEAVGKGGKTVRPKRAAPNVGGPTGTPKPIPFNWQVASAEMGAAQRMPDRLKAKAPGVEGTTEFQAYVRLLTELAEAFEKLKKAHHKTQEK